MRYPVAACLLLLAAGSAWAQDRPATFPTRDVTVTYHNPNGHEVTIEYGASAHRMRISGVGAQGGYGIIERDGSDMFIVMPERHMAMRVPETPQMRDTLNLRMLSNFRRSGSATVAGVSCQLWNVDGPHGTGEICITGDGVLLRARDTSPNSNGNMLQATKVDYHSLPAGDFEVPAGYQTMTMPQGMPGGMPPGGMPPDGMPPGGMPHAKPQP